jgi:hypothetical protein
MGGCLNNLSVPACLLVVPLALHEARAGSSTVARSRIEPLGDKENGMAP